MNINISCEDELKNKIIIRSPKIIDKKIHFEIKSKAGIATSGHYNVKTEKTIVYTKDETQVKIQKLDFKQTYFMKTKTSISF